MLIRRYNLLESEENAAKWLVEQRRNVAGFPEFFGLHSLNERDGFLLVSTTDDGKFRLWTPEYFNELVIQSLVEEGLLNHKLGTKMYGLKKSLFEAVDSDFGRKVGIGSQIVLTDDVVKLTDQMIEYFSKDDLDDLSFRLGVAPDMIGGGNRSAKTRELVLYCAQRGRFNDLMEKLKETRPKVNWLEGE